MLLPRYKEEINTNFKIKNFNMKIKYVILLHKTYDSHVV